MKKIVVILFVIISGCKKTENIPTNICMAANPEEIEWIKKIKDSQECKLCQPTITIIQASYHTSKVFYFVHSSVSCDYTSPNTLFDCNGNVVKKFAINEQNEFTQEVINPQSFYVYKCQ